MHSERREAGRSLPARTGFCRRSGHSTSCSAAIANKRITRVASCGPPKPPAVCRRKAIVWVTRDDAPVLGLELPKVLPSPSGQDLTLPQRLSGVIEIQDLSFGRSGVGQRGWQGALQIAQRQAPLRGEGPCELERRSLPAVACITLSETDQQVQAVASISGKSVQE